MAMKPQRQRSAEPRPLQIQYDSTSGGWIVLGGAGRKRVFNTKMDAENYCIKKLHKCPVIIGPTTTSHQELPHNSVWTGDPWDHTFANVTKRRRGSDGRH